MDPQAEGRAYFKSLKINDITCDFLIENLIDKETFDILCIQTLEADLPSAKAGHLIQIRRAIAEKAKIRQLMATADPSEALVDAAQPSATTQAEVFVPPAFKRLDGSTSTSGDGKLSKISSKTTSSLSDETQASVVSNRATSELAVAGGNKEHLKSSEKRLVILSGEDEALGVSRSLMSGRADVAACALVVDKIPRTSRKTAIIKEKIADDRQTLRPTRGLQSLEAASAEEKSKKLKLENKCSNNVLTNLEDVFGGRTANKKKHKARTGYGQKLLNEGQAAQTRVDDLKQLDSKKKASSRLHAAPAGAKPRPFETRVETIRATFPARAADQFAADIERSLRSSQKTTQEKGSKSCTAPMSKQSRGGIPQELDGRLRGRASARSDTSLLVTCAAVKAGADAKQSAEFGKTVERAENSRKSGSSRTKHQMRRNVEAATTKEDRDASAKTDARANVYAKTSFSCTDRGVAVKANLPAKKVKIEVESDDSDEPLSRVRTTTHCGSRRDGAVKALKNKQVVRKYGKSYTAAKGTKPEMTKHYYMQTPKGSFVKRMSHLANRINMSTITGFVGSPFSDVPSTVLGRRYDLEIVKDDIDEWANEPLSGDSDDD